MNYIPHPGYYDLLPSGPFWHICGDLLDSIQKVGQLQPIYVKDGCILDGMKRWAVLSHLGIEPWFEEWEGNPFACIMDLNFFRRHHDNLEVPVAAGEITHQQMEELRSYTHDGLRRTVLLLMRIRLVMKREGLDHIKVDLDELAWMAHFILNWHQNEHVSAEWVIKHFWESGEHWTDWRVFADVMDCGSPDDTGNCPVCHKDAYQAPEKKGPDCFRLRQLKNFQPSMLRDFRRTFGGVIYNRTGFKPRYSQKQDWSGYRLEHEWKRDGRKIKEDAKGIRTTVFDLIKPNETWEGVSNLIECRPVKARVYRESETVVA